MISENNLIKASPLEDYHFSQSQLGMMQELRQLTGLRLTNEHLALILAPWYIRQDLINIMNDTDLTLMKKKVKKFINLYAEFHALFMERDGLCLFERMGIPTGLFVSLKGWKGFEKILNKKRGSPFNKEKIIKEAYFELLFIAETLGINPPTQNYQQNDFKKFLKILLRPLNIKDKTIEHYYQEYVQAKSKQNITIKINELIKNGLILNTNILEWDELISEFRYNILTSLLA